MANTLGPAIKTRRQRTSVKRQKYATIVEEVETFEDLGPRIYELLLSSPKGTRIYLRVRDSARSAQ